LVLLLIVLLYRRITTIGKNFGAAVGRRDWTMLWLIWVASRILDKKVRLIFRRGRFRFRRCGLRIGRGDG